VSGSQGEAAGAGDRDQETYRLSPKLVGAAGGARTALGEALQAVGNQLIAGQVGKGRRGATICGASRGVGTTFVAANLAVVLANAGISTLLVDANLHDPGVGDLITPSLGRAGLQDILRNDTIYLADVVHHNVLTNLSILYSGGRAADASELLGGAKFERTLRNCLRDFEYTIVDTAPANQSPDCRRASAVVGYALIVARRNQSFMDDVSTLANELTQDGALIAGTIMNGV
jgi:protein-tyrosine kinase